MSLNFPGLYQQMRSLFLQSYLLGLANKTVPHPNWLASVSMTIYSDSKGGCRSGKFLQLSLIFLTKAISCWLKYFCPVGVVLFYKGPFIFLRLGMYILA